MKHRKILDAAVVAALLLAHVPGLVEELPLEDIPAPVALIAAAEPDAQEDDA